MNTVAPRYLHTGTPNFFARRAVPGRTLNSPTRLRTRFQWLADLAGGRPRRRHGPQGCANYSGCIWADGCTLVRSARAHSPPRTRRTQIVHADAIALPADRSFGYLLALRNAFSRLAVGPDPPDVPENLGNGSGRRGAWSVKEGTEMHYCVASRGAC
ncbi:hypothetical protein K466DRAFT_241137 [Polyporus arcularius HHB13444]|uniref:Uncharacterized protein n=1 Tax=Polyporus arcularius HHB13444 TaxID=1314778 RepID=A0A5C3PRP9_9APHY|nr:hypothetical protein K466DRAFT_241137 [Polyporus arcularius HHB13444]